MALLERLRLNRGGQHDSENAAVVETWSTSLVEPERRLDYWIGRRLRMFSRDGHHDARFGPASTATFRRGNSIQSASIASAAAQHVYPPKGQRRAQCVELLLSSLQARMVTGTVMQTAIGRACNRMISCCWIAACYESTFR